MRRKITLKETDKNTRKQISRLSSGFLETKIMDIIETEGNLVWGSCCLHHSANRPTHKLSYLEQAFIVEALVT